MFAFIEGKVCDKSGGALVLLAGGVGYQLTCSMQTLQKAPAMGETMRCYTYFSVREDAVELFGFATREEKDLFLRLTAVSGVGPKLALGLLGAMSLHDLQLAIVMDDVNALSRAPGIGKKTAQRIALELRDKIRQEDISAVSGSPAGSAAPAAGDSVSLALEALISLGYSAVEARSALAKVRGQSEKTEELISLALRAMTQM